VTITSQAQQPNERLKTNTSEILSDRPIQTLNYPLSQAAIASMRQSKDLDSLLKNVVNTICSNWQTDRALIYRFKSVNSGVVLSESVVNGWTPFIDREIPAIAFGWPERQNYLTQIAIALDNTDNGNAERLTPYQKQLLEQLQVKSSISLPILVEGEVWGLLVLQQCSQFRRWEDPEINLLSTVALELINNLQRWLFNLRWQEQAEGEKSVAKVIEQIGRSEDVKSVYETTTREARLLLKTDRVAVYRFDSDWNGQFIAESVATGWEPLVGKDWKQSILPRWDDTYLQETQGGRFRSNENYLIEDIHNAGLSPCHVDILEQMEAKSYAVVPIFEGRKLWGLLAAYQNSRTRKWQNIELRFLRQISTQFSLSLQQVQNVERSRSQSDQLEELVKQQQAVAKIIARIRQSIDLETIFETTTNELRLLLKVDRVLVYRFNPDWSGMFVAESVASGWTPLMEKQDRIPRLQESISSCNGVGSLISSSKRQINGTTWTDTYLQENQGAPLRTEKNFIRDDISQAGFAPCYLEILEQYYQVRAYAIVPVFQGEKLWGMLAAFQNSEPRKWQEAEVRFLEQIAGQFSVAVQQAEYVSQIQEQTQALIKTEEREKSFVRFLVKINQQIVEQNQQKRTLENLFVNITKELRKLLKTDRVTISRFNPDWSHEFISEEINASCVRLVGTESAIVEDPDIQEQQGGRYQKRENLVVNELQSANLSNFESEWLEQLGVKACVISPILKGNMLWGLLGIYINSSSRVWEEGEVNLIAQAGLQLGIALQQSEYIKQVQEQSQKLLESAEREKAAKEQLQQRAAQLLIAVKPAFSGDLTVRAPITDDEIGTIADAYNGTLQSLRKIVSQVQEAAEKVSQSTKGNVTVVERFVDRVQIQFQNLTQALEHIQKMLHSTQVASKSASKAEMAVQQSNQTLQEGDTAMNLTVDNITKIRETVAETVNRIERLSESSQKISKVVQLIGNFTSQTNLLAMNASLEATRAGEYGKGFAVVADEVRSLSHQSAAATSEIEELVSEIQTEISAVLKAMQMELEAIAKGSGLVEQSRASLNEIVTSTNQISQLINDISQVSKVQQQQAEVLTRVMKEVGKISNQTSEDSMQMYESFQGLMLLAQELQTTAGKFRVNP
jgi:methyl-accepting chemotaxis protein PixJ